MDFQACRRIADVLNNSCSCVFFITYFLFILWSPTCRHSLSLQLLMLLCPSDEASGPLLGRCVSLLYWCGDRPLGPAALKSPESNKSMAYCSQYCTLHRFSLTHDEHALNMQQATQRKTTSHQPDETCIISVAKWEFTFYLRLPWITPFLYFCVQGSAFSSSMNHFNSLQSASRGHSQHSVQTDGTCSHAGDSCPLQSERKNSQDAGGGQNIYKY